MQRNGFGLLEILVVIAIIALLFGGASFLMPRVEEQKTLIKVGQQAEQKALDAAKKLQEQTKAQEDLFNQLPQNK